MYHISPQSQRNILAFSSLDWNSMKNEKKVHGFSSSFLWTNTMAYSRCLTYFIVSARRFDTHVYLYRGALHYYNWCRLRNSWMLCCFFPSLIFSLWLRLCVVITKAEWNFFSCVTNTESVSSAFTSSVYWKRMCWCVWACVCVFHSAKRRVYIRIYLWHGRTERKLEKARNSIHNGVIKTIAATKMHGGYWRRKRANQIWEWKWKWMWDFHSL